MKDVAMGIPYFLVSGLTIVLVAVGGSLFVTCLGTRLSARMLCREAERTLRAAATRPPEQP